MQEVKPDSFVFYRSFYDSISNLPDNIQLVLYRGISNYALNREQPSFDSVAVPFNAFVKSIWAGIRPQLDANYTRRQNGYKGGAPRGSHNNPNGRRGKRTNQELTKNKPNVNVNENENENVNENVSLPFSSSLFLDSWNELTRQPKWKKKTKSALQKSVDSLAQYPEAFAVELINQAIANDWQGIVFQDTPGKFHLWEQSHPTRCVPITRIEDL